MCLPGTVPVLTQHGPWPPSCPCNGLPPPISPPGLGRFSRLCHLLKQVIEFYLGIRSTALLNIQQSHPKKILVLLSNISSDHFWEAALLLSARQQALEIWPSCPFPAVAPCSAREKRVLFPPHLPSLPHAASKTWGSLTTTTQRYVGPFQVGTQGLSWEEAERRALDWPVFPRELHAGLVRSVTLRGVTLWKHCIVQTGLLQGMFESTKLLPRLSGGAF